DPGARADAARSRAAERARRRERSADVGVRRAARPTAFLARASLRAVRIHQLLASLEFGDAVATYALTAQQVLRSLGHESEIFTHAFDPRMEDRRRPLAELEAEGDAAVVYHHTFWSEPTLARLQDCGGRRAMIYHNVTPDHFFAGYDAELRRTARRA